MTAGLGWSGSGRLTFWSVWTGLFRVRVWVFFVYILGAGSGCWSVFDSSGPDFSAVFSGLSFVFDLGGLMMIGVGSK